MSTVAGVPLSGLLAGTALTAVARGSALLFTGNPRWTADGAPLDGFRFSLAVSLPVMALFLLCRARPLFMLRLR